MKEEITTICPKCKGQVEEHRIGRHAYCLKCFAAYMKGRRTKHSDLPNDKKIKANARSYANVYVRRGKLIKMPCEVCGELKVQAHHDDYSKPLEVRWLCKKHHRQHHLQEKYDEYQRKGIKAFFAQEESLSSSFHRRNACKS